MMINNEPNSKIVLEFGIVTEKQSIWGF